MSTLQIHVDRVASFRNEAPAEDAELALEDGSAFLLDRELPHFGVWVDLIANGAKHGWHLYAACEPSTRRLKVLLPSSVQTVESLQPAEGGGLLAGLRASNAPYVLRDRGGRYQEMKEALERALATGEPVVVTAEPYHGEILDVRQLPRAVTR